MSSPDNQNRHTLEEFRDRATGRFGAQPPRGEAVFEPPVGADDGPVGQVLTAPAALAVATVPALVRDRTRTVLGFAPAPGESLLEADARMALENRDRLGEVPGWGRDAYNMLAAGHVAETGQQLHSDDVEDMGAYMHFGDVDDYGDEPGLDVGWDADVRARYAAEAREVLAQMPASAPPF